MRIDEVAIIFWEGSEFKTEVRPQPLQLMTVGFIMDEDDISITVAGHLRKYAYTEKAYEYQMSCIRWSQITKIQRIPSIEKAKEDDRRTDVD